MTKVMGPVFVGIELLLLNWVSGSPTLNRHLPTLSRRLSRKEASDTPRYG